MIFKFMKRTVVGKRLCEVSRGKIFYWPIQLPPFPRTAIPHPPRRRFIAGAAFDWEKLKPTENLFMKLFPKFYFAFIHSIQQVVVQKGFGLFLLRGWQ